MNNHQHCPSCGFNLVKDEPLVIGDWKLDPRGLVEYRGESIKIMGAQIEILYALAAGRGRAVSLIAIYERLGSRANDHDNVIKVQICKLRRDLARLGIPSPISVVRRHGYRWQDAAAA